MSWIIGILLVLVGAIIGFFCARFWRDESQPANELEEKIQQSQQQLVNYQREVSEHFATASALVEQLADTQQKLQKYLNQSAELLQNSGIQDDLPFFSEDTLRQLRVANTMQQDSRSRNDTDSTATTDAPRDYSEHGSGLFVGKKDRS
ncbi:DUF1043 domain-containing protein [Idiomarina tyrosinivorans]|uniref:Z-ring associated protein G n=1 Tax=Idiomarina tyrosinivorans TaxID=1445662 RepID=A0A432ZQC1_9GAMM|nr:YhcB family protein [Idiomarina tyrosinivorans]RUO80104.1 DUF1043 domain-containing protein [Idiomarina tyrosinivorans]